MSANTSPIFSLTPNIMGVPLVGNNTASDGSGTIGTNINKVFTGGTNGSYLQKIRLSPFATVASTATAATVFRIFISTLTTGATASTNTWLFQEIAAPAQTADAPGSATAFIEVSLGFALPAGYTILVTTHVANSANTGWTATVLGGDF
jgi:hypothetical protein